MFVLYIKVTSDDKAGCVLVQDHHVAAAACPQVQSHQEILHSSTLSTNTVGLGSQTNKMVTPVIPNSRLQKNKEDSVLL